MLKGKIVGAMMVRQYLENENLEKEAEKKDKEIKKLQKKLEHEKVKSFKHKHKLHEWERGERTIDDPSGKLPDVNWSEEYKHRRTEAEKEKERRAFLEREIVEQPENMPKLKQTTRRGIDVVDLTSSSGLTPEREVKMETTSQQAPKHKGTSEASHLSIASSTFKRRFEDELQQQQQFRNLASPTQSVYPEPATKKTRVKVEAVVKPLMKAEVIELSDESTEQRPCEVQDLNSNS